MNQHTHNSNQSSISYFSALDQEAEAADEWGDELDDSAISNDLAGLFGNGNSDPMLVSASSFYGKNKPNTGNKPTKQNPRQNPAPRSPAAAAPAIPQMRQTYDDVDVDRLIEMAQEYDGEYAHMLSEEDLQVLDIPDVSPTTRMDSGELQETSSMRCTETSVTTTQPDLSGGGAFVAKASIRVGNFKCLHLSANLSLIADPSPNRTLTSSIATFSRLQSLISFRKRYISLLSTN